MNRKQKIIVSITGIIIVVLALLGLTYAYFVTQIQGNENDKSIEVTTANLKLVYGDGNGTITATNIMPNNEAPAITKTFTVTNNGTGEASYVAVLQNVSFKKVSDNTVLTSFERQSDLRYALTCKQYNGETETGTCDGVTDTTFPTANNLVVMVSNKIPKDYVQKYTLTINYIDPNVDQSNDMDKGFSAKVNIMDIKMTNPYATLSGTTEVANDTLAYNIINNAKLNKNGTGLVNSPLTKIAQEASAFKYKTEGIVASNTKDMPILPTYQNYYWTYGTGYTIDETTGKFTLTGVHTCKYNDTDTTKACPAVLVDKYIITNYDSGNSNSANITKTTTNLNSIYKVITAPVSTSSTITSTIKTVTNIPYSTEKELAVTPDDYGTSYYFRGGVEDNYLNYSGMCWRIVRIEGDGSTKLILEDEAHECNSASYTGNWKIGKTVAFGYVDENHKYKVDFLNYNGGLANNLETYQSTLTTKVSDTYAGKTIIDYLRADEWCYDNIITSTNSWGVDDDWNQVYIESEATNDWYTDEYYGAATRIITNKKPSLKCSGTKLTNYNDNTLMYVGTLTADEISFAGGSSFENPTFYLINDYSKKNVMSWWTLSPTLYNDNEWVDESFLVYATGLLSSLDASHGGMPIARPAVTLTSGTEISDGDGTLTNPYVLK